MSTTTQDHIEVQELVFPAAGERREPGGRPERTGGGAPAAGPPSLSPELACEAVDRAGGRRRVRQTLGVGSERISDEVIDELLAGASTEEEIAGPGGLLADLTKRLLERAMEVELTDHLGYEPHREPPGGAENQRNGSTGKTLMTEHGLVALVVHPFSSGVVGGVS
jgi:hypothetical protein